MSAMVIVGAGECGARAASTLRQAGWDGAIELLGAERHLPYERPPLSKAALLSEHEPARVTVHDEATLADLGINHRAGTVVIDIDRDQRGVVLAGGERVGYERVLLTTGASPRMLPMAAGLSRVHTLRTHDDSLRLRASLRSAVRVAVIGGGFIGLELAAAAVSLGCNVTVLEAWRNALDQAVIAAHNMIDGNRTYEAVPWFWSDQCDLSLQVAGLPAEAATEVVRGRPDGVHIRYGIDGAGRLISAAAVGTGNAVAKDIRLAEMAIAKRVVADPAVLANPTVNFKQFLR
jgi:NADPH-dependent 2,4-dienoyl-CoA reductase/sulfur reductase-like enzyme